MNEDNFINKYFREKCFEESLVSYTSNHNREAKAGGLLCYVLVRFLSQSQQKYINRKILTDFSY